jgi:hypothetical protein
MGCLVFWAVATGLILLCWDRFGLAETAFPREVAVLFNTVALGLCVVPMAATLLWIGYAHRGQKADQQLVAVLGGTGVRMFVVLGAGLVLTYGVPLFMQHQMTFWLWVLVAYLVTLTMEIAVLVRCRAALDTHQKEEAAR